MKSEGEEEVSTGMGFWVFADRNLLFQSRAGGSRTFTGLLYNV